MTIRLPQPKTKARFLLIGYGLGLLFWLGLENHSTLLVALLGFGAALIYITTTIMNRFHSRDLPMRLWCVGLIVWGAIIGAASTLTTALLMVFKSSWHGHLTPDYPPQLILDMLTRLPIWTLSGLLIGFCCSIFIFLRQLKIVNSL